jgi:hypothetical protein
MWNLRLVEMEDPEYPDEEPYMEIREVFYDQLGKPFGHTTATMGGESIEDIRQYLQWALACLEKPVIYFGDDNADNCKDD